MRFQISRDARPQAMTLLFAAAISILLWFIPFAELLTYPFRIFVTFIHEGGHALAALLTGNSVGSLSVAMDGSGETYATSGGVGSQLFIASAGYLGSMSFGALLLILIRKAVSARLILFGSAILISILTLIFGVLKPIFGYGALTGVPFTLAAGVFLTLALLAVTTLAGRRVATFSVSLLAVQCILNAILDLKTVLFLSSPFAAQVPTDAVTMSRATGLPALLWAIIWIGLAVVILMLALRIYIVARDDSG